MLLTGIFIGLSIGLLIGFTYSIGEYNEGHARGYEIGKQEGMTIGAGERMEEAFEEAEEIIKRDIWMLLSGGKSKYECS